MTRAEWIELAVIAVLAAASWLARPWIPFVMPLWQVVLELSALLLTQSLVRDIFILLRRRRSPSVTLRQEMQCFCLESTVGTTGVVVGAVLAGLSSSTQLTIARWELFLADTGTLVLGFLIKDLVVFWKPFGVRREKDHLNLIVRWKRKNDL